MHPGRYEAMELRGLAAVVLAVALAPVAAHAQTAATSEPTPAQAVAATPRGRHGGNAGIGARLGGGMAYAEGVPDAWLARLDYEAFFHIAPRHTVGGVVGFVTGFEFWRGPADHWGFDLPTALVFGVRAVAVRGLIGIGGNAFLLDQVADDTGFGIWAPMALANVGLDILGFTLMADARVSRRWQIGAPDHTQLMISLMLGATLEPKHNPRAFQPRR